MTKTRRRPPGSARSPQYGGGKYVRDESFDQTKPPSPHGVTGPVLGSRKSLNPYVYCDITAQTWRKLDFKGLNGIPPGCHPEKVTYENGEPTISICQLWYEVETMLIVTVRAYYPSTNKVLFAPWKNPQEFKTETTIASFRERFIPWDLVTIPS